MSFAGVVVARLDEVQQEVQDAIARCRVRKRAQAPEYALESMPKPTE